MPRNNAYSCDQHLRVSVYIYECVKSRIAQRLPKTPIQRLGSLLAITVQDQEFAHGQEELNRRIAAVRRPKTKRYKLVELLVYNQSVPRLSEWKSDLNGVLSI